MAFVVLVASLMFAAETKLTLKPGWEAAGSIASEHATQAAAADAKFAYAVSNTTVAQYDRTTGKQIQTGTMPDAKHLNSAYVHDGKIYCAHSNYPKTPHESDIRVFDPATGKLTLFHRFREPPGSLVWCVVRDGRWWCCFAHYGNENAKTALVEFADGFRERRRWTFPNEVVADWDGMSTSGGIWDGDSLIVSHHHFRVLYRLTVPKVGDELQFVEALRCPFPGQGIAIDPKTGGLVGIDRGKKSIVFAEKTKLAK